MDDARLQGARKRFYMRCTQWYHKENAKTTENGLDAPDIAALLQAAGFTLRQFNFGREMAGQQIASTEKATGCRVIIECGSSGLHAELCAPAGAHCNCARYSSIASAEGAGGLEVKEQASFWHITTSQERLNVSSSGGTPGEPMLGSSLLPKYDAASRAVTSEVLQLICEFMAKPPQTSTLRRSMDLMQVQNDARTESQKRRLERTLSSSQDALNSSSSAGATVLLERRASISCCEDIKRDIAALKIGMPPPKNWSTSSNASLQSSTTAGSTDAVNSTFNMSDQGNNFPINVHNTAAAMMRLRAISKYVHEVMDMLEPTKVTSKPPIQRRTSLQAASNGTNGCQMSVKKKPRMSSMTVQKPPLPHSVVSDSTRRSNQITSAVTPTPAKPNISSVVASTNKTDPRRRTFVVQREPLKTSMSLRAHASNPSVSPIEAAVERKSRSNWMMKKLTGSSKKAEEK